MSNSELLIQIEKLLDKKLEEKLAGFITEESLDEKLAPINQRFDQLDKRLDKIEDKVDIIEKRTGLIEIRLNVSDQNLKSLEKDLKEVSTTVAKNQELIESHKIYLEGIFEWPNKIVKKQYFIEFAKLNNLQLPALAS